jgi:hypothetical protein
MRHVLVVYSDMRQSARPLDIEHVPAAPLGAALATVAREHLFADLTGVEIYIYGVHAVGKDVRYPFLPLRRRRAAAPCFRTFASDHQEPSQTYFEGGTMAGISPCTRDARDEAGAGSSLSHLPRLDG